MFIVQRDMAHSHKQSVSQPVRAGRQAGRGSGFKQSWSELVPRAFTSVQLIFQPHSLNWTTTIRPAILFLPHWEIYIQYTFQSS